MSPLMASANFLILKSVSKKLNRYLLRDLHKFSDHFSVNFIDLLVTFVQIVEYEFENVFQRTKSINISLENFIQIKRTLDFIGAYRG